LQRCPCNSEEQLGQIEDASFFRFVGTGFADPRFAGMPVPISTILGAVVESGELTIECGVKLNVGLMSGVVAQIQPRENMNVPGHECESGCAPGTF
jgi:hypothetical protein